MLIRDVPLRTGSTWFVSLGDHPWGIAALMLVLVAIAMSRRDHKPVITSR